jgi:hypothetical protein
MVLSTLENEEYTMAGYETTHAILPDPELEPELYLILAAQPHILTTELGAKALGGALFGAINALEAVAAETDL